MAHLNGLGTKSDIRTAVKYLQLAAQNQNIRAILKLADMQAGGRGIPRSCQGYFLSIKINFDRRQNYIFIMHVIVIVELF